jgi:hypothetical protein
MKNNLLRLTSFVAIFTLGCIHSCKKDLAVTLPATAPPDSLISTSFIEEFQDVPALYLRGWISENNPQGTSQPNLEDWYQGAPQTTDKSGNHYGYPAYSYYLNKDEYIFSPGIPDGSFSSWLITPILSVKNGDKISFYAYGENNYHVDNLQLLMSQSASYTIGDSVNSIGNFKALLNIPVQPNAGSFPLGWTKFEYTFSGISGNMKTRIAFRHYIMAQIDPGVTSGGIGIDQFKFEVSR